MSKYTGKPVIIDQQPHEVAARFADLRLLRAMYDAMPAEELARVGELDFTQDALIMKNPQIGEVRFEIVARTPDKTSFTVNGPLPMNLAVSHTAAQDGKTRLVTELDVDIPAMLKPFVGPQMQKAVDQLSDVMARMAQ